MNSIGPHDRFPRGPPPRQTQLLTAPATAYLVRRIDHVNGIDSLMNAQLEWQLERNGQGPPFCVGFIDFLFSGHLQKNNRTAVFSLTFSDVITGE